MQERRPLREKSDEEIYDLVKLGQDSHKWSLGLYLEVMRRGPEILDRDSALRADWDAYHREQNMILKSSLDGQVLPKLTESFRLISEQNRLLLEKISKSIIPPSFSAALLQNVMPKIEFPKYNFPKLDVSEFDYQKLDYALRAEVAKENPSLEELPLVSAEVQKATDEVLIKSSDLVGLLAQIVETSYLTAERVKPPRWPFPVAIATLVLTAAGLGATILIAIFS